jgi:hypothetical protein
MSWDHFAKYAATSMLSTAVEAKSCPLRVEPILRPGCSVSVGTAWKLPRWLQTMF